MSFRKELLEAPERESWAEPVTDCSGAYIIPLRKKHSSGYNIVNIVASTEKDGYVKCGDHCDVIELHGSNFRIDCSDGVIHIFNFKGFDIGDDLSSVELIEKGWTFERWRANLSPYPWGKYQ